MRLYKFIIRCCTKNKKLTEYNNYLFIGPHPDDIEMGCGALIARLSEQNKNINFLICTDGRYGNAYLGDIPEAQIVEIRHNELLASANFLGVRNVTELEFCDAGFYSDQDMQNSITKVISEVQPDVVFVCDPDVSTEFHQDHLRIGTIVKNLMMPMSKDAVSQRAFNVKSANIKSLVFYFSAKTNATVKSGKYFKKKLYALFDCHKSQFPQGSSSRNIFEKYLKIKKLFGKEESFRVIDKIKWHCFPEAEL